MANLRACFIAAILPAFAAGFLDFIDDGLRRAGIGAGAVETRADIADDNAGAFTRQQQRNPASDSPSRAGNDGDLAGNDVRHSLPPSFFRVAEEEISPTPRARSRRSF